MIYGAFNAALMLAFKFERNFIATNLTAVFLLIIIFACFEKVRKELFIANLTNSKTKRQLMRMFNQSVPSALVSSTGQIQLCNETFENMLADKFRKLDTPTNFLKFVQNDTDAHELCQRMLAKAAETKEGSVQF